MFVGLTKLESLETLNLSTSFISTNGFVVDEVLNVSSFDQIDWQSFKRLNKIKKLMFSGDYRHCLLRFLNESGSHATLKQLEIKGFTARDELFQAMGKKAKCF